ncbi:lipopolysaccharide transport periplasmic protein LptA [Pseudaquabacterium rugosum]|uniref:Lipopolysaccharide export system protein LptA n=1 Tax=Pseudaquabacterium rugosum TaxID=2984194 RepID=A0ABU9B957_9BURK
MSSLRSVLVVLLSGSGLLSLPAMAASADRTQPLTLESDKPCTVNLARQVSQCSGNVVITQGTLVLRAEQIELRESREGHPSATASGSTAKPAQYRQKRDGSDETVEGSATRIDYDGKAGTLRFVGQAVVRRLRGTTVADEITGGEIVWDNVAEQISVSGGAASAGNPGGRVRAVIQPRATVPAAPQVPLPLKTGPSGADRP